MALAAARLRSSHSNLARMGWGWALLEIGKTIERSGPRDDSQRNSCAIRQPELIDDVSDMVGGRGLSNHQLLRNLPIRKAAGDQEGHLALARGEFIEHWCSRRSALYYRDRNRGHGGKQTGYAAMFDLHYPCVQID